MTVLFILVMLQLMPTAPWQSWQPGGCPASMSSLPSPSPLSSASEPPKKSQMKALILQTTGNAQIQATMLPAEKTTNADLQKNVSKTFPKNV